MKTNKILSCLIAAALICNVASPAFSAAKRDVNDPVLREIINELSKKMPKFIDKYGETVFVEDEPITRGSLISAIYEYDKRIKGAAGAVAAESAGKTSITRQEFDALKNKVAAIEKKTPDTAAVSAKAEITRQEFDVLRNKVTTIEKTPPSSGGKIDSIALMATLEPNMPALIDKNLKNSKAFKDLQQQVAVSGKSTGASPASVTAFNKEMEEINKKLDSLTERVNTASLEKDKASSKVTSASQKELTDIKKTLMQIQTSYVALSKRIDELDSKTAYASSSPKSGESSGTELTYINKQLNDIRKTVSDVPSVGEMRKEIDRSKNQTQADIERIEKRLNNISKNSPSASYSEEESKGNSGATIATISLGITMIAALFVAR